MVCWCFDPPRAAGKLVQKVQGHSELLGAIRYFVCSVKGTGLDTWFCFFLVVMRMLFLMSSSQEVRRAGRTPRYLHSESTWQFKE